MQLYKLANNMNEVMELIENGAEGLEDTLEALNFSFEEKVENCIMAYRNIIGARDMCKSEAHRLSERANVLDRQAETLKRYVEVEMRKLGREEVKSPLFKIKMQMNPPSVNIFDEFLVPQKYFTEVKTVLSKSAVMDALKQGVEVPGAEIKQEKSLRIS